MKAQQLDLIIRETLQVPVMTLWSTDALHLLLGTAAAESSLVDVIGDSGKSLSIFQINEKTYIDIWNRYLIQQKPQWLVDIIRYLQYPTVVPFSHVKTNLALAIYTARLKYYMIKEKLPNYKDVEGMAAYWKKYYNTHEGKGTEKHFIDNYNILIANNGVAKDSKNGKSKK